MKTWKEHLQLELKEFLGIVLYLAASFSLLATFKSLILIQIGINDIWHAYAQAAIMSLALGKIVMLAQNISILNAFRKKSLLLDTFFKSAVMSGIVYLGGTAEEKIFAKHVVEAPLRNELTMLVAHVLGLFVVFFALFLVRGLNKALGPGKLLRLLKQPIPECEPDSDKEHALT